MDITGPTGVGGPGSIEPRKQIEKAQRAEKAAEVSSVRSGDKVELSDQAQAPDKAAYVDRLLDLLKDVPDVRAEKLAEIRREIEAGTYETEERINGAIDRLLEELA